MPASAEAIIQLKERTKKLNDHVELSTIKQINHKEGEEIKVEPRMFL